MYVNMYVCTSTCMYIHVHVYTYIYVYEISIYPLLPGSIRTNISNIEFVYLFECGTFMYSTQTPTTVP